ncbi:MAG TPA: pitrilysin family protein [bacterium]|nr:pitrilysin family protein [bacterium]
MKTNNSKHSGTQTLVTMMLCSAFLVVAPGSTVLGESLADRVVEHRLDNGMTFLLLQRPEAPVLSAHIRFRAGGVNEPMGKTGIAHLLEHMAFKGTRHLGTNNFRAEHRLLERIEQLGERLTAEIALGAKGDPEKIAAMREQLNQLHLEGDQYLVKEEIWDTYLQNGAQGLNASTSKDVTSYYVSLPSNRLELWALIESQRMMESVMREFYRERDVVAEERRRGYEDRPDGKLYERFISAAFIAHPYGNPTIGWMSDIQTLTIRDAESFFNHYYVPSRAVAAIVGDIDIEKTVAIVEKYFGRIPSKPEPLEQITQEPEQGGEKRIVVEFDAEPQILIGFQKPTLPEFDDYVFDVIDGLLTRGRTSRLYTRLVKQDQVATRVYSFGAPGSIYPNLFVIGSAPRHPHTSEEVEKIVFEELGRMAQENVTERELLKVKNQLKADFLRDLRSNNGLADKLSYFEVVGAGWRYPIEWVDVIERVTPDDVRRVASQYFSRSNTTVATLMRKVAAEN